MSEDTRSMKELAREALDVQNASNLTAVAKSFAAAMVRLRRLGNGDDQRFHPITILWVSKISDLSNNPNSDDTLFVMGTAIATVKDLALDGDETESSVSP